MKQPSSGAVLAWLAVVLVCAYWPVAYDRMVWETAHFELMLMGKGVTLSLPARLIISQHVMLFRLLFGVSAAFIVLKEPFVRDKRLSLLLTLAIACLVMGLADATRAALTYPLQYFAAGLG